MEAGEGQPGDAQQGAPASEEELRRRLEEELRKLRIQDLVLQTVVSLINLTARRIGKEDERDLDQAKIGIDAIRGLVDLLDDEPGAQVRNALSELQMEYARAAGGEPGPEGPSEGDEGGEPQPDPGQPKRPPGLWTPPGTS